MNNLLLFFCTQAPEDENNSGGKHSRNLHIRRRNHSAHIHKNQPGKTRTQPQSLRQPPPVDCTSKQRRVVVVGGASQQSVTLSLPPTKRNHWLLTHILNFKNHFFGFCRLQCSIFRNAYSTFFSFFFPFFCLLRLSAWHTGTSGWEDGRFSKHPRTGPSS